jgi:hypothetical protein
MTRHRKINGLVLAAAVIAFVAGAVALWTIQEHRKRAIVPTAPIAEHPMPSHSAPTATPLHEPPAATESGNATPSGGHPYRTSADFNQLATRLREASLSAMEPQVIVPTSSRAFGAFSPFPWKRNIVTTVFAIGEKRPGNKGGTRRASAWNPKWQKEFGGADPLEPKAREEYRPRGFTPGLNPFYCALPYSDVTRGTTKPEARTVVPWFSREFMKEGQSVCRDRWVAIRSTQNGKVAYAQWSDCGPFGTDHWQYVFGNDLPRPNANHGAGLAISPAVRDYLGLSPTSITDWKFVEFREIPKGPWSLYGENNHFVRQSRSGERPPPNPAADGPKITTP